MPKDINTKVGETGVKLSGGQRQRLAIARALLKQTKIILFDESTSSLDNFAQSHIQQSIEAMKGKHTVVIVAHRLSTIKNVDKIYFLDDGKIVDSGTFEELFNSNTQFKNMFLIENIQTKKRVSQTFTLRKLSQLKKNGGYLLSHGCAVPSARAGLTALFGMGRGGTPPL